MNIYKSTQTKDKVRCFLFPFLIVLLNANISIYAQWSGSGTSVDPFLINNATDLAILATNVNNGTSTYSGRFFRLTANLNLNGNSWTPIGTSTRTFQGNFDGNNHIVSGLTINLPSTDNVGLFGYMTNGIIRNLGVETSQAGIIGRSNTAILLGTQNGGNVTNCYVMGKVSAVDVGGGLIGNMAAASSSINGCYAFAQVFGNTNTNGIGGLVGVQRGGITNSYAFGSVQGNGPAGGIAGTGSTSAILSNSYSTSSVSSNIPARIGGLTGNQSQSTASLKNSVAINESVKGMTSTTGRVLGFRNNTGSAVNNYAWDKMPVTVEGRSKSVNPNANDIDGASQTLSNLKSYPFYNTITSWGNNISPGNSGSAIWNIWNDYSYPYLQTQSAPVDENEIVFSGTTVQGTFRPDVVMDSISVYIKIENNITRLGMASTVDNTNHIWIYNDPMLNTNGILHIFAYESGKAWPSYPVTDTICSFPPTFDAIDISSCVSAVNLQNAITNLQNANINNVQFSKSGEENFDTDIILSPRTYSVNGIQTIYVRATSSLGCKSTIKSFQVKQTGSILFKEDFRNNSDPGGNCTNTPLGSDITSYTFGGDLHTNGRYNICSQLSDYYGGYWYYGAAAYDHTDPGTGRSLIVNADFDPGKFYTLKINNICPGSHLFFSAWLFNLVNPNAPNTSFFLNQGVVFNNPNLRFVLTDGTDGTILAQYDTDSIPMVTNAATNWRPYGFEFITGPSSSIVLTLYNNAPGGNGNDLMIDDIEVYLCVPPVTIDGEVSYCAGETTNLTVKNEDGSPIAPDLKVNWLFSTTDDIGPDAHWTLIPGQITDHLSVIFQETGYLRAVVGPASAVDAGLYNCCSISDPIQIILTPELMYWKKNATDNNWNNPDNWVDANDNALNEVPSTCTDVHIPGNAAYYPSLDSISTERTSEHGNPVCRDIYFHFGAEVAKPHYLAYRKAYIQYNFGYYNGSTFMTDGDPHSAVPINRGRWYVLATPLKKIVSGDFSVGGFPNFWQQGFRSYLNQDGTLTGEWEFPGNSGIIDIGAQQNYAISIWGGEYLQGVLGEKDHHNLNDLKGIFQMPYFEDSLINAKHRVHTYIPADSTSRFHYYYFDRDSLPIEPSAFDDFARASESYRFVFEDNIRNPIPDFIFPVSAGTDIMVGNPFVSSLDFENFYNRNSSVIENYYRLYINNNFETFSLQTGSPTGLTKYIASFQGFFVTTKGIGTVDLHFPISSSVTRPGETGHQLKSASESINNIIRINASNKTGSSWTTLVLNPVNTGSNVLQLFMVNESSKYTPQLYTLSSTKKKNVIQYESGNTIDVSIGITCAGSDSMTLSVQIPESFNYESLLLLDTKLNKKTNLLTKNTYTFKNEPETGERFLLRIRQNGATGIESEENSSWLRIYVHEEVLDIQASENISDINIITVQGNRIFSETGIDTNDFTTSLRIPAGVYIVTAKLKSGEMKTQKIILANQ